MMRLLADSGFCVERGLRRFREQRPPGIYKHDYIDDLFKCGGCVTADIIYT